MKRFDYVRASSLAQAVAAFSSESCAYLGGGTNLIDLMKGDVVRPDRLIDSTKLPNLDRIEHLPDGSTHVGALVRNGDLAHDTGFARRYPAVAEALLSGASAQLRNAATTGGNILQRTRCPYFTDVGSACNRREPDSGCDAVGGETRLHAVLGWSDSCIAVHPSDFCVALVALDTVIKTEGKNGSRLIPMADFHQLPGDRPSRETALEPGDFVTGIVLPPEAAAFATHARYLKVRDRTSYAFAVVSSAAALRLDGDRIIDARFALGGVAMKPWRSREAEAALVGRPATTEAFRRAAEVALAEAKPSGNNGYKIELARRIAVRSLALALAGTPSRTPALPGSPFSSKPGALAHV